MKPIGGYFSLELPMKEELHKNAIRLNTGRNCLEYILRARQYRKVYIPYYTCEVILEPFKKLGIQYEFYHVDVHLEIKDSPLLKEDEALLYVNYYGLKQRYVEKLAEKVGKCLIVDNTQAFYAKPIPGIDTFYTCRKFFGVPDGAYLYTDKFLDENFAIDQSFERMTSLTKRIDIGAEAGYEDFQRLSKALVGQPIRQMSTLTQRLMQSIDYKKVAEQRRANYLQLQAVLDKSNILCLPLESDAVPMIYPYMVPVSGLREKLIENKIYVARYWPNVLEWTTKEDMEFLLACQVQPLPIDQRYDKTDMFFVVRTIELVCKQE